MDVCSNAAQAQVLLVMVNVSWLLAGLARSTDCMTINVVSVLLGGNPAYANNLIAATYDIAFQDAKMTVPGAFTGTRYYSIVRRNESLLTCSEEAEEFYKNLGQLIQLLGSLEGLTVIQTPGKRVFFGLGLLVQHFFSYRYVEKLGLRESLDNIEHQIGCTDMALLLGDVGREMNAPLILSTAAGDLFLSDLRFPTTLVFGPADHGSLRDAGVAMLEMYNWTTVSLVCSDNNTFADIACKTLYRYLSSKPLVYDVKRISLDHTNAENRSLSLLESSRHSRIIFLFAFATAAKPILVTAAELNMTSGEYVFLYGHTFLYPWQIRRPWSSDAVSRNFARALILYANIPPNFAGHKDTIKRIISTARHRYSANLSTEAVNALSLAAYEGILCLAVATNDLTQSRVLPHPTHLQLNPAVASTDLINKSATTMLIDNFRNRTFNFESGSVYMDGDAYRRVDVMFWRPNNMTMDYEAAWYYDVITKSLTQLSFNADAWPAGYGPPANKPLCGFSGRYCFAHSAVITRDLFVTFLTVGVGLVVIFILLLSRHRLHFHPTLGNLTDYLLDTGDLSLLRYQTKSYLISSFEQFARRTSRFDEQPVR